MLLFLILGVLTLISLGLQVWQWLAARRFPLHQRIEPAGKLPSVTLLKPLKGCDAHTATCLRSWLRQGYPAPVQVLFGVKDADDPVCAVVRDLLKEFPSADARLVECPEVKGPNLKVSTLMQLEPLITGEAVVISDADVLAPPHYLAEAMTILQRDGVGLVNSFYRFANPLNPAMWIEAIAVNCDFWSQVCQSNSMRPMKFALGAAMGLRRETLQRIGGFRSLVEYLADDNRLGLLVHQTGQQIALTNAVVDCHSGPMTFRQVWDHQLRWARTIRVCEPVPFFFSVLTHCSFWSILLLIGAFWSADEIAIFVGSFLALVALAVRHFTGKSNWRKLTGTPLSWQSEGSLNRKDILGFAWWLMAFLGNTITWRGKHYRILKEGRLRPLD